MIKYNCRVNNFVFYVFVCRPYVLRRRKSSMYSVLYLYVSYSDQMLDYCVIDVGPTLRHIGLIYRVHEIRERLWKGMAWYGMARHGMAWNDMTLHDWHDMTWHDMTWHDMTWHDMTWHDMTWHDMTWHDMTWHDKAWYDMAWHHITSHSMPWYGMAWHRIAWDGRHDLHGYVMADIAWHGMAWHGTAWHGMAWHDIARHGIIWNGMVWLCVKRSSEKMRKLSLFIGREQFLSRVFFFIKKILWCQVRINLIYWCTRQFLPPLFFGKYCSILTPFSVLIHWEWKIATQNQYLNAEFLLFKDEIPWI